MPYISEPLPTGGETTHAWWMTQRLHSPVQLTACLVTWA